MVTTEAKTKLITSLSTIPILHIIVFCIIIEMSILEYSDYINDRNNLFSKTYNRLNI